MDTYVPFCGTPPIPAEFWTRWLFDPVLIAGLAALGALLAWRADSRRHALAAWGLVTLLFVSPICAASMALFSARVAQHLLLTLVAAPLLARAMPLRGAGVLPAASLFGVLFWLWHAPPPYAATLASDAVYWLMHLSLVGAAWLMWSAILAAIAARPHAVALGLALTAAQMSLLSALLVFAQSPWHAWHLLTTLPYGISPMADQHLAGAIMWVTGGALMLCAVAALVRLVFRGQPGEEGDARTPG
ncbi:cytochrome c oxidase assembly protein [Rhodobacteraceae bacterium ASV31]|nr:cytochrome c oxidase assembly protein [Anianabacter salinae]